MTDFVYTGDDPLLRWYSDNGADWFTEAKFDHANRLERLAWYEAVDGVAYRAVLDRVLIENVDAVSSERTHRILVDVADIFQTRPGFPPSALVSCSRTRQVPAGAWPTPLPHEVSAFTQDGTFFVYGGCPTMETPRLRAGVGATFFTDPGLRGTAARDTARSIIALAKAIEQGKTFGRKPWVSDGDAAGESRSRGPRSIYNDCSKWPWR